MRALPTISLSPVQTPPKKSIGRNIYIVPIYLYLPSKPTSTSLVYVQQSALHFSQPLSRKALFFRRPQILSLNLASVRPFHHLLLSLHISPHAIDLYSDGHADTAAIGTFPIHPTAARRSIIVIVTYVSIHIAQITSKFEYRGTHVANADKIQVTPTVQNLNSYPYVKSRRLSEHISIFLYAIKVV